MRQFSLYKRGNTFYVRFKDETTGKYLSGISTGETNERAAMATVYGWERDGIPTRDGRSPDSITDTRRLIEKIRTADLSASEARSIVDILTERGFLSSAVLTGTAASRTLADYLREFWDYDRSPYVKEKLAHRQSIGRKHCYTMARHVKNWWTPFFPDTALGELSREDVRAFSLSLADAAITDGSRLHIMTAGTTALRWAVNNGLISSDPSHGIARYAGPGKRRDVLTAEEIGRLFSLTWPSESARLASLTAATTGLRAGEIAALRSEDIGADRLHVRHSWSDADKLKLPKNGEVREVPLLPEIRDKLREHAARNPWGTGPDRFVFWSTVREDRPVDPLSFNRGLYDALTLFEVPQAKLDAYKRVVQRRSHKSDPDPEDLPAYDRVVEIRRKWQTRGIVFHSWRHHYAATMASIVDRRAMAATGHKSAAMFDHYADHATAEQFREVADASRLAFARVLQFPGARVAEQS
jgi:integrase